MPPKRATPRRHPDPSRPAYQRAPGTVLLGCARCGANYLDDPLGRAAHKTVFGHQPKPPAPPRKGR
jgi:hypothetical protein